MNSNFLKSFFVIALASFSFAFFVNKANAEVISYYNFVHNGETTAGGCAFPASVYNETYLNKFQISPNEFNSNFNNLDPFNYISLRLVANDPIELSAYVFESNNSDEYQFAGDENLNYLAKSATSTYSGDNTWQDITFEFDPPISLNSSKKYEIFFQSSVGIVGSTWQTLSGEASGVTSQGFCYTHWYPEYPNPGSFYKPTADIGYDDSISVYTYPLTINSIFDGSTIPPAVYNINGTCSTPGENVYVIDWSSPYVSYLCPRSEPVNPITTVCQDDHTWELADVGGLDLTYTDYSTSTRILAWDEDLPEITWSIDAGSCSLFLASIHADVANVTIDASAFEDNPIEGCSFSEGIKDYIRCQIYNLINNTTETLKTKIPLGYYFQIKDYWDNASSSMDTTVSINFGSLGDIATSTTGGTWDIIDLNNPLALIEQYPESAQEKILNVIDFIEDYVVPALATFFLLSFIINSSKKFIND